MMKPTQELRRFSFLVNRDGELEARGWANKTRKVYIAAARDGRLKHGKHDMYYRLFVESAYSLRWVLRHVRAVKTKGA